MWKELIRQLNDRGMTDKQIGEKVGLSQPTITRLKNGVLNSTAWENGQALIALRDKVQNESEQEAA